MAKKKVFTDESLATFIEEIKSYTDNAISSKANKSHTHNISDITNLQSALDGKAASTHNHSASNINSGTLSSDRLPTIPINKGGTGATTASGALVNLGITATTTELNYVDGVTSSIQAQLNGKAASSHSHSYIPLSGGTLSSSSAQIQRAGTSTSWVTGRNVALLKTNTYGGSNGSSAYSPILSAKSVNGSWDLGTYTSDVLHFSYITDTNFNSNNNAQTANIQFKTDGSITANTFNGALSGNATTATTATKLGTNAGSATQPVYFSGGKPVATTYTIAKSVPADAKFTDTWRGIQNNLTSTSTTDSLSAAQGTALKALVDGKAASSHTHNYAGSSSAGGSASSSVKLDTATAGASNKPVYFSGGKPVAGSYELNANIKSHSGSLSSGGWKTLGGRASGSLLSISYNSAASSWNSGTYSASLVWGCSDTKGLLDCSYSSPVVTFGGASASGGSDDSPTWYMKLSGTSAKTYNLDNFAASSHNHAATNITSGTLSSDRLPTVPISKGGTGATTAASALTNLGLTATSTELNYCDGVTSNIQTQLNGKAASSHTHSYAGSSSAGGAANSATKLDSNTTMTYGWNGVNYFNISGTAGNAAKTNDTPTTAWWHIMRFNHANSSGYYTDLAIPFNDVSLHYKRITAGSVQNGGWIKVLDSNNYTSYAPTKTGSGASGTWGINVTGSSASCTGNAATATKLATARTIALGTGATGTATSFNGSANITIPVTDVKESYLSWGGRNLTGSVTPLDAAASSIHSANRLAFAKPAGITIEYSTDGSTWTDYGASNAIKGNLVSGIGTSIGIGKVTSGSSSVTTNYKLRITLNAVNMGVYTRPRKMLINISSGATKSQCLVEYATLGAPTTFTTLGTYQISGWSGWNSIPVELGTFGGGSTQTSNRSVIRLTFNIATLSGTATNNFLNINDIILLGDTYWSHPSTMAKTGHLYTYDSSQNATFPATVTAPTISGTTYSGSGVATVAEVKTYLGIS